MKYYIIKDISFMMTIVMLLVFLGYSITSLNYAILETIVSIICLGIIYAYDIKFILKPSTVILLCFGTILHPLGVFGFYSHFLLLKIIGYDKIVHLSVSFILAHTILDIYKDKKTPLIFLATIISVMGLGAILEINEFIGEMYFGINTGGLLTMSDSLPYIKSDLQRYDTHYDMVFNLIGSLSCVLMHAVINLNRQTS